jgi:hypothetical protein
LAVGEAARAELPAAAINNAAPTAMTFVLIIWDSSFDHWGHTIGRRAVATHFWSAVADAMANPTARRVAHAHSQRIAGCGGVGGRARSDE